MADYLWSMLSTWVIVSHKPPDAWTFRGIQQDRVLYVALVHTNKQKPMPLNLRRLI